MTYSPNRLLLPSTLECPFPARLRLNYLDLAPWTDFEILSIPGDAMTKIALAGLRHSQMELEKAVAALKAGSVPSAEVPRVSGTAEAPTFQSTTSLLHALKALGFKRLPLLATKAATPWLRANFGAESAPDLWRTDVE